MKGKARRRRPRLHHPKTTQPWPLDDVEEADATASGTAPYHAGPRHTPSRPSNVLSQLMVRCGAVQADLDSARHFLQHGLQHLHPPTCWPSPTLPFISPAPQLAPDADRQEYLMLHLCDRSSFRRPLIGVLGRARPPRPSRGIPAGVIAATPAQTLWTGRERHRDGGGGDRGLTNPGPLSQLHTHMPDAHAVPGAASPGSTDRKR